MQLLPRIGDLYERRSVEKRKRPRICHMLFAGRTQVKSSTIDEFHRN
jgi:hypothetical protein